MKFRQECKSAANDIQISQFFRTLHELAKSRSATSEEGESARTAGFKKAGKQEV